LLKNLHFPLLNVGRLVFIITTAVTATAYTHLYYRSMAPTRASSTRHRSEINIANNAELRANSQSILATIRESRPKNTTGAYKPKQKEFKVSKLAGRQIEDGLIQLILAILRGEAISGW